MNWRPASLAISLALLGSAATTSAFVLGGGPRGTDCYGAFDGVAANHGPTTVDCVDGDPSCDADGFADGACTFSVRVCAKVAGVPRCHPRSVDVIKLLPRGGAGTVALSLPALPATTETCGAFTQVSVSAGPGLPSPPQPGEVELALVAAAKGRRKKDHDRLVLRCLPSGSPCPDRNCGPNMLSLTIADAGSDFDLGWAGLSHNVPMPAGWQLRFYLEGCDGHANPVCQAEGTGVIATHPTLSPPLPFIVGGVPLCIITRLATEEIMGSANVQTGAFEAVVNVLADIYVTRLDVVCPRCVGGVDPMGTMAGRSAHCDSGPSQDGLCGVDGSVTVAGSLGEAGYLLSANCPPAGTPAATVPLTIGLTTGASSLAGPSPCTVPGQPIIPDDACGGGTCTEGVCSDCVGRMADGQCVATRGGIQQACCSTDPTRPCFPTGPGTLGRVERIGTAIPPAPAWPLPTYPKTAEGTKVVATFCVPSSGSSAIDVVPGYGPAALVLPVKEVWQQFVPG